MMINFSEFHFIRPFMLWGFIPAGILILLLLFRLKNRSSWSQIVAPHLLKPLLQGFRPKQSYRYIILLSFCWLLGIIALAGPTWKRLPQPVFQKQGGSVIAFDLSNTMLTEDLLPNRLARARYKLNDLLEKTSEGQTGLVVFSKEAYIASPLTRDTHTIKNMVAKLTPAMMPIQGQNIAAALTLSSQLLAQSHISHGNIILFTSTSPDNKDFATAEKLAQKGYKISVFGIGTEKSAPIKTKAGELLKDQHGAIIVGRLDRDGLQSLAAKGQGQYIDFHQDDSDIQQLQKISQPAGKVETSFTTNQWQDEGHWFVFLILPFAAFGFRRGLLGEIIQ